MSRIRARLAVTSVCAALAIVSLAAWPLAPQQPPQFKSGVDLVTLDLNAMGPDGTPVSDLRADEVRITVGGQPRTLRSFQYVAVAPPPHPTTDGSRARVSPPSPPATNLDSAGGRSVFVLIFHEHIRTGDERIAMEGVRRIIDQLEPRDRVALLTMPFGRVEVDLTADHERVKSRLHQIVGRSDPRDPVATGSRTNSESLNLLAFLRDIAPLAGPKTVLLISEGFQTGEVFDARDTNLTTAPALLDRPETAAEVPLLNNVAALQGEIYDLRMAAAVARAQFYVIQPYNYPVDSGFRNPGREGIGNSPYATLATQNSALAALAGVLGGRYLMLSGKAEPVFDRIVRETSGYYAVAFETLAEDREGKAEHVEVATTRKGITLRARRTFLNGAAPGTKKTGPASVPALLKDGASQADLSLGALAFVTRAPNGEVRVMALAQSRGAELKEAGFVLVNAKNTVVASWPADLSTGTAPVVSTKVVAPGHYRLRAAAIDANGAGGAVDYEFEASLATVGSFQASSLMTGVQEGSSFKPRLSFTPADDLVPYFELYGTGDVEIVFELTPAGGGPAVLTGAGDLTATRDADRRIVTGTLPLGSAPAGDYVLRATVRSGALLGGTLTVAVKIVP